MSCRLSISGAAECLAAETDWSRAGKRLGLIRSLILTNLMLGLITAVLGAAGPSLLAVTAAS